MARPEREMDRQLDAAIHAGNNDCVSLKERQHPTRQNVSRAEADRGRSRQQDVSGANADTQSRTLVSPHERGFEFNSRRLEPGRAYTASHSAAVFVNGRNLRVENILETGKLGDGFSARCRE